MSPLAARQGICVIRRRKTDRIGIGVRDSRSCRRQRSRNYEKLVILGLRRRADPGCELGWEAGILSAGVTKPQPNRPFWFKSHGANDLPLSASCGRFRLFATAFRFFLA